MFRKTNISYPLIRTPTCAYQGVRNVSFSENFAYVLHEWTILWKKSSNYVFLFLQCFSNPFSNQFSHFILHENTRKPWLSYLFTGYKMGKINKNELKTENEEVKTFVKPFIKKKCFQRSDCFIFSLNTINQSNRMEMYFLQNISQ